MAQFSDSFKISPSPPLSQFPFHFSPLSPSFFQPIPYSSNSSYPSSSGLLCFPAPSHIRQLLRSHLHLPFLAFLPLSLCYIRLPPLFPATSKFIGRHQRLLKGSRQ